MPRYSTYPTLYDQVLQLNISKLKVWGYLEPDQLKLGTLTWSSTNWGGRKEERGSISIRVNTLDGQRPFVELDYKYRDEPRNYKVRLVTTPSNLGKGVIWYFLCPHTNKRCRKLYLIGGHFLHREAFSGGMYESQTKSKKWRNMEKVIGSYFGIDEYYSEIHKKHFTRKYAGKPTKKYLKLKGLIDSYEKNSTFDIERLLTYGY